MGEEKMWKEIKCKVCGTQEKKLFMIQPTQSSDDCYCEECRDKEIERRAKQPN